MIHMHAIPAAPAKLYGAEQPRIVYLTNTEVDNSGKVRAIHSHADLTEIGLVYNGNGVHNIGGREYHSEPGDIILYNTNVLHQDLSGTDGAGMRFFLCGVSGLHIDGLPGGHIAADPSEYVVKSGPYFEFLLHGFEVMERGLIAQSPQVAAFAQGFLTSLLAVLNDVLAGHSSPSGAEQDELSLAEEMRRFIDQNYTQNFSLEELANHFHINRFYAAHVFSDTFNCSPMQYRTRRRVGEAQSLLTSTDCSVTYIASVVGYDDPNRFSQVFSKIVGMPPSKYRDLSVRSQQPFHK
ncbi:MAG: helix-turn-helix domain-containing protein [Butyricicoccus sp.]